MQETIDYLFIEKEILSNKDDQAIINKNRNILVDRVNLIDYIMERFLDEFEDMDNFKCKKFMEDHNQEYSQAKRLIRIIDAYSKKH